MKLVPQTYQLAQDRIAFCEVGIEQKPHDPLEWKFELQIWKDIKLLIEQLNDINFYPISYTRSEIINSLKVKAEYLIDRMILIAREQDNTYWQAGFDMIHNRQVQQHSKMIAMLNDCGMEILLLN
jgi:hypothetical protein